MITPIFTFYSVNKAEYYCNLTVVNSIYSLSLKSKYASKSTNHVKKKRMKGGVGETWEGSPTFHKGIFYF